MSTTVWSRIADTVSREFSDIGDVEQMTKVTVRLALAGLLGFVLGFEREARGKAAGARTHMLVAMGSALFVLTPQFTGMAIADMSRVVQGLLAGVGFLCAGAILKSGKDEQAVQGLTTAAGMWMTAAIGLACGLGREVTAILSTLLALVVLALVPHFSRGLQGVMGNSERAQQDSSNEETRR